MDDGDGDEFGAECGCPARRVSTQYGDRRVVTGKVIAPIETEYDLSDYTAEPGPADQRRSRQLNREFGDRRLDRHGRSRRRGWPPRHHAGAPTSIRFTVSVSAGQSATAAPVVGVVSQPSLVRGDLAPPARSAAAAPGVVAVSQDGTATYVDQHEVQHRIWR